MQPIDLVLHDWMNMPDREREQALADIKALAETHSTDPRRARALHVISSFFHFLTKELKKEGTDDERKEG